MATPSPKPRLVIIGSGWAGFYLASYISPEAYNITVISPRRTSAYTPLLASAAVGLFNFYLAEEPVRSKSRNHVKYIKANVVDIDFTTQRCRCAPAFAEDADLSAPAAEFDVEWDVCILAPGCAPHTFGTPGVAEHALFMKNVSDAMAVRKRLFDLLEMASLPNIACEPERVRELLHIAIVGGGPTGVELTAELDDLRRNELMDLYPDVAGSVVITVYDAAANILGAYERKLHEYASGRLVLRKVNVETSARIESVDGKALYLKKEEGSKRVPYGMLIWATGNKNVELVERIDVRLTDKGLKRIVTDGRLRVFKGEGDEVYDNVYALGDAADILNGSLPTTAEVAVQKASFLVEQLNQAGQGSKASAFSRPFEYKQKRLVSYIGQHDGVIAGMGDREGWTGTSAWLAWRSGSIMWHRSWRSRIAIIITWTMNALFGKEIARM